MTECQQFNYCQVNDSKCGLHDLKKNAETNVIITPIDKQFISVSSCSLTMNLIIKFENID